MPEEYAYTAHDYTKEILESSIKQGSPTFQILKTEKILVSGEKAYLIVYTVSANDMKSMECYFFHKDRAFVITASTSISDFQSYESAFLASIKSIKLLE